MAENENKMVENREQVTNWLERCLIGPFSGNPEEILHDRPSGFYSCGYLSGQWPEMENEDDDEFLENDEQPFSFSGNDEDNSEEADGTGKSCRYKPPSAMGLSFFVSKEIQLDILINGARYKQDSETDSRKETWKRRQLPVGQESHDTITISCPQNDSDLEQEYPVLFDDELASVNDVNLKEGQSSKLNVRWRPYIQGEYDGYILTLSLVNTAICNAINYKTWEHTHLFQVGFECVRQQGKIFPYPKLEISSIDDDLEEKQLDLIYQDKKIFAIGHNVSPNWELEKDNPELIKSLKADFLPSCEVPLMKFSIDDLDPDTFKLKVLAEISGNIQENQTRLRNFLASYENWLKQLEEQCRAFPENDRKTAETLILAIRENHDRIAKGIEIIGSNKNATKAFGLAHQAMIDYMHAWGRQSGSQTNPNPSWRPFQLAFLLLTMPSLIDQDCVDRDVVDLLWFQTGGGKTEAYLAIIAFLVCYRRMEYGENGYGTTVIMRYTLRLLTMQQFHRASILICALELIRQANPNLLGQERISTGLWIGPSSPNSFQEASQYVNDEKFGKLVVTACPWCGAIFSKSNFEFGLDRFHILCTNNECEFGNQQLPLNVVDDALYEKPPTLLFATVDKFAMFAWKERAGRFLGTANHKPPDLIIQDELHLISSELGSITGVYEAAFDTVLNLSGCRPKYIASTATIRNAKDQARKLYAREVNIFPPPGLNWSDSFFARVNKDKPGRQYIGYHSPFLSRSHSFAPVAASLLTAPPIWISENESIRDAWWTLVAYHGSLKGLGTTQTLFSDEIPYHIQLIISHINDYELQEKSDSTGQKIFEAFNNRFVEDESVSSFKQFLDERRINAEEGIVQLTSNRSPADIRDYLEALGYAYTANNNKAVTAVLSTNMVSVGLDIARLGLMVVNGQPFTTGEYIQASSRVGRGNVPGIVIAHYFRNNSRDLSHFENFKAYHESFYRFVEPTSLTPFSEPAIKRALHAALVIVIRHACGLSKNSEAVSFDPDNKRIAQAIAKLKQRCIDSSSSHEKEIETYLDILSAEWKSNRKGRLNPLTYKRVNKSKCLLVGHEELLSSSVEQLPWKTMRSVRQVDDECAIRFVAPIDVR